MRLRRSRSDEAVSNIHMILLPRLRECAAPYFGWLPRSRVMRYRARSMYLDGPAREEAQRETDLPGLASGWDLGRIRWFVEEIERGAALDPIELESQSFQYRIGYPVVWGPPTVQDGNHRLAAAAIVGLERIPSTFGGPLTTLRWLEGKRKTPPPEVFE